MAKFYGTVSGSASTEATRCGSASSGITTHAASWAGAIRVDVGVDSDGTECFTVSMVPWRGSGEHRELCRGELGKRSTVQTLNERAGWVYG